MRPDGFDFKAPDYGEVWAMRNEAIKRLEAASDDEVEIARNFYRKNIAQFIDDWGVTFDPRLVEVGLPGVIPMVLFDKQREMVDWIIAKWRAREPGLLEKSRDCGASYVAVQVGCALCVLFKGVGIGFGSRKTEYVDRVEEPKSLFWKARLFMKHLPRRLRAGWEEWRDAPHMRMNFPETGSKMTGEAGDQIGRGDRQSIYFVDESAYLERPKLIEASLSQTTNCRIDMSSVNGMNNPFAQKRHGGKIDVFVFDWRDDPRKDDEWYEKQKRELDPVILAQEVDRDYTASVEGIVIPGAWARACIDAHVKLGIKPSGEKMATLDIADEGPDKNALLIGHGVVVTRTDEWSGKGIDTFQTVERAFEICDEEGVLVLRYDADGIGATVRGDARVINERRVNQGRKPILVIPFRGSAGVYMPESEDVKGRKNGDYFQNSKAQSWWSIRTRAQKTHRWIIEGIPCDPDEIVSIASSAAGYNQLITEMSQPTYMTNGIGKIVIDKNPEGMKSPNRGDSLMMRYARVSRPLHITPADVQRARTKATRDAMGRLGQGSRWSTRRWT